MSTINIYMRHARIIAYLLCLLPFTAFGAGQVFKWVDEQGNVHFGDRPDKQDSEVVDMPVFKTDPVMEERQKAREESAEKEKEGAAKQAESDAAAQKQQEQREKNCKTARERAEQIQTVRRLFRIDEKGERHDMSDAERVEALKMAKEDVTKWCD